MTRNLAAIVMEKYAERFCSLLHVVVFLSLFVTTSRSIDDLSEVVELGPGNSSSSLSSGSSSTGP